MTENKRTRLDALKIRAAELRKELEVINAEIQAEEDSLSAAAGPQLHHRPSWSLLGDAEAGDKSSLHELAPADEDFAAVLKDHPELMIPTIGAYNHWDRRECAVSNAPEWQVRCARHMKELGGSANIPKVIHQIWIGPKEPPCLWMDTFRVSYLEAHPHWSFQMWSDETVAKLPMINGEIYAEEKMWQCKADILRLEFLWHYGGLYVDADMISVGLKSLDPIVELGKETGFVIAYEPDTKDKPYSILGNSVIACTPHHPLTLMLILFLKQTFYEKRYIIEVFEVTGPVMYTKCLVDTNMPISVAPQELLYPAFHFVPNPDAIDYSRFPKCLMFQFGYTCSGLEGYIKRRNRCIKPRTCPFHSKTKFLDSFRKVSALSDADLCAQVPIGLAYLQDFVNASAAPDSIPLDQGVALFITDGELARQRELAEQIPGFVDQMQSKAWDVMLIGIEWSTSSEEVVLFNVPPGGRPRNSVTFAFLVNAGTSKNKEVLCSTLGACITEKGFDPSALYDAANKISLWFGAQKFAGTIEEARIWKSMPTVHRVFTEIGGHSPPLHFDRHELHGDRLKGWLHGYVAFELHVETNNSITFRAWNDDNSPNCEMRTSPTKIEWMKVFYNHQVIFETHNKPL